MQDLLQNAAERAARYLAGLAERPVRPDPAAIEALAAFDTPLPTSPTDPAEVLARLDELGSPATMGSAGGRYFGFVLGGALPASLAVNWLAGAWDQNAGMAVGSPVAAFLEEVTLRWLVELLDLPAGTGGGFVTGATAANLSGLAAARHALLARQDWDVEAQGLSGAPALTVIVGQEVHLSVLKALSLLGLGRERVVRVPVDDQGRMRADALPALDEHTIVCLQAGNVNTGAFDPMGEVCAAARQVGAWVHVDGAFGLWARAAPSLKALAQGLGDADSWATDGHKWLNVPYDSGIVLCREPEHLRAAMGGSAAYLVETGQREPWHHTPEMSRRARGLEVWAALVSLGSEGLAELLERCCTLARRFAQGLEEAGYRICNDVVLNQVLVSFGEPEHTLEVIEALQEDGTCWCSGTTWQGHTAMRISVSSWRTTEEDVDRCLEAILRIAS